MLSYQHAFHAGNHADLLKHFVVSYVLNYLNKKDKPYTVYDTHSGSGIYDLYDNRSLKTGEAVAGITKLMSDSDIEKPDELKIYLDVIEPFFNNKMYPGSPKIEEMLIRSQDFLILSELHPQEIENLRNAFKKSDKNVQIHNRNGWEMIKALTPPKTKRGAVLIDPSYEEISDYLNAEKVISTVNKKWSNGIIMLWYPLLAYREEQINNMIDGIIQNVHDTNANTETLNLQLYVADKDSHKEVSLEMNDLENAKPRLYGSGMLIINPPYMLKESGEKIISYLEKLLRN